MSMSATPLPFAFPYALAFWLVYVWAFYVSEWRIIRASKITASPTGAPRQELRWIFSLLLVAQLLAFAFAFWAPAQFPVDSIKPVFWLGLALLLAGMLRR